MKQTLTTHFLGTLGLEEKDIKEYYKKLKDFRQVIDKNSTDKLADEHIFELDGGFRFFYQTWSSTLKFFEKIPKIIVFAFHASYESSDCFYPLADILTKNGSMVVSLDYRGHGRTGGQAGGILGDIQSFEDIYTDILKLMKKYKKEYAVPMYVLGYDIGALIAIQIASKYTDLEIEGLVLISPIWKLQKNLKHILLYPALSVVEKFSKSNTIQHVLPEVLEKTYFEEYKNFTKDNPLRLKKMSLRMFRSMITLIMDSHRWGKKCNYPCLILQGTQDNIVDHFAVHKLYQKWIHPNKFIRFYENAGHNLLVDKFTQEIYIEIQKFFKIN